MLLYHFTALEFLDSILEQGLTRGEVATAERAVGLNAVWLTSQTRPAGYGLTQARQLTDDERSFLGEIRGTLPSRGARYVNKRAIRITVKIMSTDPALMHWPKWSAKRIEPGWLDVLNGKHDVGSARLSRSWYLFFRTVEPHEFVAVEHLKDGEPAGPAATWHEIR